MLTVDSFPYLVSGQVLDDTVQLDIATSHDCDIHKWFNKFWVGSSSDACVLVRVDKIQSNN